MLPVCARAEALPFPQGTFHAAVCRFAGHHFSDMGQAVSEVARVLISGGLLVLVDTVSPPDPEAATWLHRLETLRDPTHVRNWQAEEWALACGRAGIRVEVVRQWQLPLDVASWLDRQEVQGEARAAVMAHLRAAPPCVAQLLSLSLQPPSFFMPCLWLEGRRA